jgi:transposase
LTISEERKRRVIDLYYNQGKTTREIAEIERMSLRDIHTIIKEEEARRQKYKQQEVSSKAYKLFSDDKVSLLFSKSSKLFCYLDHLIHILAYWRKDMTKYYTLYIHRFDLINISSNLVDGTGHG